MRGNVLARFGERVRTRRQSLRLSQEELAARAGVHRTYIGMIERAEKNITLSNIVRIADALEMPLGKLMTLDD